MKRDGETLFASMQYVATTVEPCTARHMFRLGFKHAPEATKNSEIKAYCSCYGLPAITRCYLKPQVASRLRAVCNKFLTSILVTLLATRMI